MTRDISDGESGFSLIEALVALAILALAVTGAMTVIRQSIQTQVQLEHRLAAEAMVDRLLMQAEPPTEASVPLGQNGPAARWTVTRETLQTRHLAGAPVRWVRIDATIQWTWRDRVREISGSRIVIEPSEASP